MREEEGKRIPSIFFFLLQNDMRYIIPYSFSQQNEFYKVLLYKKCHSSTKNCFYPLLKLYSISTFAELFTGF